MTKAIHNLLRSASMEIEVTKYMSYRCILADIYSYMKEHSASYSYLQFSEDLGLSRTNVLRLVIIGQRPLSVKAAEKIALKLKLKGSARRYWTCLIKYSNARLPAERERLFRLMLSYRSQSQPSQLDSAQVEYFNEWYNPVIREMIGLPSFDGTPEWIKQNLNFPLRKEEIVGSLQLLERLRVITWDPQANRFVKRGTNIVTESEIDSLAIVRYHQKMIEIARESITRIDEDSRDIRALTVSLPKSAIPQLKGKIEEWLQEVLQMEDADSSEVYQLNVQLFPFTKHQKD